MSLGEIGVEKGMETEVGWLGSLGEIGVERGIWKLKVGWTGFPMLTLWLMATSNLIFDETL